MLKNKLKVFFVYIKVLRNKLLEIDEREKKLNDTHNVK